MANLISLTISPAEFTAAKGTKIQYFAYGNYDDNTIVDITNDCTWSSDDDEVVIVNNTDKKGEAYCNMEGSTSVVAVYSDTIYNKSDITVTATIFKQWVVNPNMLCTVVQESGMPIIVKASYIDGSSVDVYPSSVSSSDTNIATISIDNLVASVIGINAGQCMLTLNVTAPTGEQAALQEYCIVLPLVTEQIVEKNYITNGKYDVFNDYILPDIGSYSINDARFVNPFYILGRDSQDVGENKYPFFGKTMIYKDNYLDLGNDEISIITSDANNDGTSQYYLKHNCLIYHGEGDEPARRFFEFPCASITEFDNENIRIKLEAANLGTTVVYINIYYRQYYSESNNNLIDCALTWTLLPSADPNNPDIVTFDDTIHIGNVDRSLITEQSYFSLVCVAGTDDISFAWKHTDVRVLNTVNKVNPTIDAVNSFNKSNKLPDLKSLNVIDDTNKVLRTFINTKTMANGIQIAYLDNIYEDLYDVGDMLPYTGGDGTTQPLIHKGWLIDYGTTISKTRFQNLFDFWGGAKYGYGAETITAEFVIDPYFGTAAAVLIDKDFPYAGTSTAIGYSGFSFAFDSAGIPGYSITYIRFTGDGNSLYNDATNNPCYLKFFSKYQQWNGVFIIDGKTYYHSDIDINDINTVLIKISKTYDSNAVLQAIADAFNPLAFALPNFGGYVPRGVDYRTSNLVDPDVAARTINGVTVGAVPGSIQSTALMTHTHTKTLSVSVDLTTADVKTKASSGSMLGPSIDYNTSTNFDYHTNLLGITSNPTVSSSLIIDNTGTSTECRMPNFGVNWKIRF